MYGWISHVIMADCRVSSCHLVVTFVETASPSGSTGYAAMLRNGHSPCHISHTQFPVQYIGSGSNIKE